MRCCSTRADEPTHTRVRVRARCRPPASATSIRDDSVPATWSMGRAARDAYLEARLGVEPFTPEFTAEELRALARGRRAPVKVVPARPAADRRSRQHLRRRGAVPGQDPSTASRRQAHARPLAGAPRRDRGGAPGRDRREGRVDRRFPPHRRRPRIVPGPLPDPPAAPASRACGAADTVRKIVVGGRGTYVCEHCQIRPRRRKSR